MTSACDNKLEHLRTRSEFVAMRAGKKMHASSFVLQMRKRDNDGNGMRVGFTVTKKTGNAVVRNRIKRRLRAVAQDTLSSAGMRGHDYVLIGKRSALNANFDVLVKDMHKAMKRLHQSPGKYSQNKKSPHKQEIQNGQ